MLPFPKRKKAEEIELDDGDVEVIDLLEDEPIEIDVAELEVRPELPRVTSPPPKASLRRLATPRDRFEDDVADECLKSIAAATSRARLSDSFPASIVPASPHLPRFETSVDDLLAEAPLPQFEISDTDETTRRPALSSQSLPIARDSVPGVLPVPSAPASASSIPTPVFSRTSQPALPAASSIAPVAMNSSDSLRGQVEPTVILVRQPPKTAWIVAAAFLGATCALVGMRILTRSAEPPPAVVVTAPPQTQATPAAAPPPATVRFNDDQGVAVTAAPAPSPAQTHAKPVVTTAAMKPVASAVPATKPATKPAASLGPKLPDGTLALTAKPSAAPPAAPPQPEPAAPASPPTKKKLTPEQELAEAQLKASMK